MRDYIRTLTEEPDHRQELVSQLEASEGRIRYCEYQLDAGAGTLSAARYDQILAECNSELKRYNQIEQELEVLENPRKSPKYKEMQRRYNKQQRENINY